MGAGHRETIEDNQTLRQTIVYGGEEGGEKIDRSSDRRWVVDVRGAGPSWIYR